MINNIVRDFWYPKGGIAIMYGTDTCIDARVPNRVELWYEQTPLLSYFILENKLRFYLEHIDKSSMNMVNAITKHRHIIYHIELVEDDFYFVARQNIKTIHMSDWYMADLDTGELYYKFDLLEKAIPKPVYTFTDFAGVL